MHKKKIMISWTIKIKPSSQNTMSRKWEDKPNQEFICKRHRSTRIFPKPFRIKYNLINKWKSKIFKRIFTKEDRELASTYMKRCHSSGNIKTRYYYLTIKWIIVKIVPNCEGRIIHCNDNAKRYLSEDSYCFLQFSMLITYDHVVHSLV